MRIVIVGQKWLGAEALKLCLRRGDDVALVIAPPAEGEEYDRLYSAAQQVDVPAVIGGRRITEADIPAGCDLILAAHAHAFIAPSARDKTRLGALGYHPSLLPRHRGRDAVRWTIHMRDAVAGGTVYWMDDGADTGPIAAQDWCHVRPDDTPATLWRRALAPLGIALISSVLGDIDRGLVTRQDQDEDVATWEPSFKALKLSG